MGIYFLCAVILLFAVYLFMVFPGNGKKADAFTGKYIAHRGLHGDGLAENTLPAFQAAIDAGYGIELDVQLSSDEIPVVCHDYDLKRVFGVEKKVSSLTASELEKLGVPRFETVLSQVGGKVPLVAEMKGENLDCSVCEKAAALLDRYHGSYCVESFNPFHLRWFRKHRPSVIRGQLSSRFTGKESLRNRIVHFFLRHLLGNCLSRPHFIAYEHIYGNSASLKLCRRLGARLFCWTPRSLGEISLAEKHFTVFIFENCRPSEDR